MFKNKTLTQTNKILNMKVFCTKITQVSPQNYSFCFGNFFTHAPSICVYSNKITIGLNLEYLRHHPQ